MLVAGIDVGSRTIETLLYDGAQVVETIVTDTGSYPKENAKKAFNNLLAAASVKREDVETIVSTGYGRNYFEGADRVASEIMCHARGASYLFPNARTVIDIGGQDSKMIGLDAEGKVQKFVMNDRCAAGTGKFIELVSQSIEVPLDKMAEATVDTTESCDISSMCAVFAESEIIGLLQRGTPLDIILRGVFKSIARRTLSMAGRVGLNADVVFTGGVAQNAGVTRALEEESGVQLHVPPEPQITGALGAALVAAERN
ncbi:MAG: 2-hydroxyglutaryl-CoA dehydratase [Planctomycetota bacterium]|nr:MAG: 2-hydroxyglutaryl-CoA dehydratase [Planctomycetota bacterium]